MFFGPPGELERHSHESTVLSSILASWKEVNKEVGDEGLDTEHGVADLEFKAKHGEESDMTASGEAKIMDKTTSLMTVEATETGVVSLKVLWAYIEAAGATPWIFTLIMLLIIERIFYAVRY